MSDVDNTALKTTLGKATRIDFQAVQRFVLQVRCIGCHNPKDLKDGVDMTSYSSISDGHGDRKFVEPYNALGSAMYTVLTAKGDRHMPPLDHAQLTDDQITLIYLWIENGAKPTPDAVVARPPSLKDRLQPYFTKPENIDYGVVKSFVLGASCMKCHSLTGDSPDKDAIANSANMTTYASLFNPFTPIVVKGDPENSKLYQSAAITLSMPPEEKGYDPIDSLRLKLVRLWILNCAIEDKSALPNETLNHDPKNPDKVRDCGTPATP
jgi:hypothetical protein